MAHVRRAPAPPPLPSLGMTSQFRTRPRGSVFHVTSLGRSAKSVSMDYVSILWDSVQGMTLLLSRITLRANGTAPGQAGLRQGESTERRGRRLIPLLRIRDIPLSNLGPQTNCPDWGLCGYPQYLQTNAGIINWSSLLPIVASSFLFRHTCLTTQLIWSLITWSM